MSVRPTGATASTRPLGPLTFSRAPAPREVGATTGGAAAEVSLSDLARATGAPPGAPNAAAAAAPTFLATREARAEMARALATLSEPVRAFSSFTLAELSRGAALLRGRVLRSAFSAARDVRRPQMNDLSQGLSALARTAGSASSLESDAATQEQTNPSWRAFVLLTRSDRTLLSLLYVSAQTQGGDLRAVDDVVRALLALRQREQGSDTPRPQRELTSLQLAAPRLPNVTGFHPDAELEPSAHAEPEGARASQPPRLSGTELATSPSFGSALGLAARAVTSYRSLLPAGPATLTSLPPRSAEDLPVAPRNQANDPVHEGASSAALVPPFSAAQALGVSSLIDSLTRNLQTARRPQHTKASRGQPGLRASTGEQNGEREARRRARWHELFRRRRALRSAVRLAR